MPDPRLNGFNVPDENLIEGKEENIEQFMAVVCMNVDGIGRATAGAIAVDFEHDLQAFLNADKERFSRIKKSSGANLLRDGQIDALLEAKDPIPRDRLIEETWVFYLGRKFLQEQAKMVQALSLDNFDINPLLAKALTLDTPRKVIAFNVYQTVTRSVVTSWGNAVESLAKYSGCKDNDVAIEGQTGTNFDLIKTIGGTDYYIQVKSGPNTMNVGMVTSLNNAIARIEQQRPNAQGILGMTYGTRDRISNQITANLNDADTKMKIGREFWDFISEREDYHKTLFELLEASSAGILSESFIDLIESKIVELEEQWEARSTDGSIDDMLENYI
ncbi:MAG: TdeIII family type II restriction endonuclease [Gaiellales bacterium]|nr:MAG: TdeIII family type II restriction endonuclease [Gaiellales bacterium]